MPRRSIVFAVFIAVLVSASGCRTTIPAGENRPAATYSMGTLRAEVEYGLSRTYRVTEKSLRELGLVITQKSKNGLSVHLTVRDSQDKKITIELGATAEGNTKISIKAEPFGNKRKSRLIYYQIVNNLP